MASVGAGHGRARTAWGAAGSARRDPAGVGPPGASRTTPRQSTCRTPTPGIEDPARPRSIPHRDGGVMREDGPVSSSLPPAPDPLTAVLLDIERHAGSSGWDQPWRVFALVETAQLLAHEPALAETLGPETTAPWTPVEQDQLPDAATLEELLHQLAWPDTVDRRGSRRRARDAPGRRRGRPAGGPGRDPPGRRRAPAAAGVRLAVAVLRAGGRACAAAVPSHDDEQSVLSGTTWRHASPTRSPRLSTRAKPGLAVAAAAFWGFVGGFALIVGAVAGLVLHTHARVIGLVMAFGGGVLISALAFDLAEESFARGGTDAVALGLAAGAITFFVGDWFIDRAGGADRKRSGGQHSRAPPEPWSWVPCSTVYRSPSSSASASWATPGSACPWWRRCSCRTSRSRCRRPPDCGAPGVPPAAS